MAFNFPSSPTVGQIFTSAGKSYIWDGTTWKAAGSNTAVISDTPPAGVVPGQLWWESDSGRLFIWYDDGNSTQWVQVSGGPTIADAPADGGEYVRVNGVWRLRSQSVDLSGVNFATGKAVAIPTGARLLKFTWDCGKDDTAAYVPSYRLSVDGTTFLSGAGDYTYVGNYLSHNATVVTGVPQTAAGAMILAVSHSQTGYSNKGHGAIRVSRPSTAIPFGGFAEGYAIQSIYYQSMYQFYMNSAAQSGVLAFKAISFGAFGYTGTFSAGSIFDLEWVY